MRKLKLQFLPVLLFLFDLNQLLHPRKFCNDKSVLDCLFHNIDIALVVLY